MNPAELRALRTPLLALLAALLVGASAIYYSDYLKKDADRQLLRQQGLLKDARTRLQKSGDEKDIIVRYLDGFRQLERAGFIGEEQRINWLDGLRLANQEADIFGVDYQIGTQRAYAYATSFNAGQISLNQSTMQLKFRLLHEEDLMRFFNSLARQGGGLFTVDQCTLKRLDNRGVIRYQPNLSADCELSWITAKVGSGNERPKP